MEILFMVFMVVVSIMALFAVMVVFRDVVGEVLQARRERESTDRSIIQHAERIIAEAEAAKAEAAKAPAPVAPAPVEAPVQPVVKAVEEAPVAPAVVESVEAAPVEEVTVEAAPVEASVEAPVEEVTVEAAPVEEAPAEEVTAEAAPVEEAPAEEVTAEAAPIEEATEEADAEENANGTISFALGQQQTIDEKYYALPAEQRAWYDEIIKYATMVEGSKRFKNARYEEYKVGKNRIVRITIKRGVIQCEFILHNTDFKNYVNENKINIKQSATTMLVENAATVDAVKNSIDIVVASLAAEREYKKQLAREKRRAARAAKAGNSAEAETVAEAAEAVVEAAEAQEAVEAAPEAEA